MNLETQIQNQLEQLKQNIVIVEKQGPQHYIGIRTDPYLGVTSRPVTYGGGDQSWKLVEAEVSNYLVSFKELGGVTVPKRLGEKEMQKLIPIMAGMMEGTATHFNPKPLYRELPLADTAMVGMVGTYTFKEEFFLRCGKLVFMEKIGERKTLTEYTFNNGTQSAVFGIDKEKNEPLYQVVKVTFCLTEEIAKIAAKKYTAREAESIIIRLADLPQPETPKKRTIFERLFSS